VLARILGIILPVFSIVALGWLYGRRVRPDMGWINRISMNVLAPALIFSALASKDFDVVEYRLLILGSLGVVLGSGLLAWPFTKLLREDFRTFVPPMMFNNCGNMGLPLAALAFGQAGLSAMVALFVISNLLHFTLGVWMIDHHAKFGSLLRNPMVWSTFAGFAFALLHPPLPVWAATTFKLVGDALIPMMLLSLGVRLTAIHWRDAQLGVIGALVCPLTGIAMAALLSPVLGLDRTQQGLLILFGCLPPAVLNFMVAEQFSQEPAKVASIVLVGNALSIVFVPLGLALALPAP
jgi:malate permease and related proteins